MKRRNILIGAAAAAAAGLTAAWLPFGPVRAEETALFPDDRILGSADAPITIRAAASGGATQGPTISADKKPITATPVMLPPC